jgi:hypothetical protein
MIQRIYDGIYRIQGQTVTAVSQSKSNYSTWV